jgi:hypothetical protein
MSTKSSTSSKSSQSEAQSVKLPPAQPRPPPRADHSDFSLETLSAYLDRLEGWNPGKDKVEDEELYQQWIDWLDKVCPHYTIKDETSMLICISRTLRL